MAIGKGSANRVTLVGNLGADPELKQTQNGAAVTTLALATNEIRKDSKGKKLEHTEWHRVVLWRKLAEIAATHLKKGSKIYVEGSLRTRAWQDQEGNKRTITEILGERLTMLDTKKEEAIDTAPSEQDVPMDESEPAEADDSTL
jgi:single-strand DNA-binding protein